MTQVFNQVRGWAQLPWIHINPRKKDSQADFYGDKGETMVLEDDVL